MTYRNKTPEVGDRIVLTGLMPNDPCPIPVGETGTVLEVNEDKDD